MSYKDTILFNKIYELREIANLGYRINDEESWAKIYKLLEELWVEAYQYGWDNGFGSGRNYYEDWEDDE